MNFKALLVLLSLAVTSQAAGALDHISYQQDGKPVRLSGKVLTEAHNGGLLVQDREGVLFAVQPQQLVSRTRDDTPFSFLPAEELQVRLLEQLPAGFRVHTTVHYLICYNTSPVYAKWCGALYERLFQAFCNYWERRGLKLKEPEHPLVALIFADQASYEGYARTELGEAAASVVGFYSLRTNRVTTFDLTGTKGLQGSVRRFTSTAQINGLLMQPDAERTGRHDHPRGDPSDRLQLRPAHALCGHPAVGQRGAGRLFRDAGPAQLPRLAEHWRRLRISPGPIPALSGDQAVRLVGQPGSRRQAVPASRHGAGRLRRSLGAAALLDNHAAERLRPLFAEAVGEAPHDLRHARGTAGRVSARVRRRPACAGRGFPAIRQQLAVATDGIVGLVQK